MADDRMQFARSVTVLPVLQEGPGYDEIIRKVRMPDDPAGDRRIYLDREAIATLAKLASGSLSGRVVIHGAQLTVELRQAKSGHTYEVWSFSGVPRAEGSLLDELTEGRPR